jgi:hypothetical protein
VQEVSTHSTMVTSLYELANRYVAAAFNGFGMLVANTAAAALGFAAVLLVAR